MLKSCLLSSVVLTIVALLSFDAKATKCETLLFSKAYQSADVVMLGFVSRVEPIEGNKAKITWDTQKIWKGNAGERIEFITIDKMPMLEKWHSYVLFLDKTEMDTRSDTLWQCTPKVDISTPNGYAVTVILDSFKQTKLSKSMQKRVGNQNRFFLDDRPDKEPEVDMYDIILQEVKERGKKNENH